MEISLGWGFWITLIGFVTSIPFGPTNIAISHVDFSVTFDGEISATIDPVLIIDVAKEVVGPLGGVVAWAFGNAIVLAPCARDPNRNLGVLLRHELIHVYQWRALGPFMPLGYFVGLPMEGGFGGEPQRGRSVHDTMWLPPPGWPQWCPFLQLSLKLSQT